MAKEPEPYVRQKVKRRRKPMTEEQRKAAGERLAKARAARQAANPTQPKNVCKEVLELDDDHYLSYKTVKGWIKVNQEHLKYAQAEARRNVKGAEARAKVFEGYIRNMKRYLENGDWLDNYYGENMNHKMSWVCVAPAYDKDGNIKRTHGVFYRDIGYRWGYSPFEFDKEDEE